jgi:hypothetical protein
MNALTKRSETMSGTSKPMLCAAFFCIAIAGTGGEANRLSQALFIVQTRE